MELISQIVDSEVVSSIAEGLMVLVGLGAGITSNQNLILPNSFTKSSHRIDDTPEDVETIARKV
jgi:D-Tyr-tRNAtyr deacylase